MNTSTDDLARLQPEILRLAYKLTPTKEIAEDCAQDALLAVWARIQDGADIEQLRAYAMAALRHRCRRTLPVTENLVEDILPDSCSETEAHMALRDVLAVIDKLPAERASLLQELIQSGAHYGELAEKLNLPIGTIMSRLSRARAEIRKALDLPRSKSVDALLDDTQPN
ncbi:RNA polymerase sigma factor [Pseudaestuariivita rosea]|uniref:RNA polymerase sigma factor n=1 Tax=Pseudaestuariivita rosea TaxID=2763263 RepID=UPI001ABA1464|nr:sigma-70 family RNA polymerase sigma factor [Pseudaestuariivita rosea]